MGISNNLFSNYVSDVNNILQNEGGSPTLQSRIAAKTTELLQQLPSSMTREAVMQVKATIITELERHAQLTPTQITAIANNAIGTVFPNVTIEGQTVSQQGPSRFWSTLLVTGVAAVFARVIGSSGGGPSTAVVVPQGHTIALTPQQTTQGITPVTTTANITTTTPTSQQELPTFNVQQSPEQRIRDMIFVGQSDFSDYTPNDWESLVDDVSQFCERQLGIPFSAEALATTERQADSDLLSVSPLRFLARWNAPNTLKMVEFCQRIIKENIRRLLLENARLPDVLLTDSPASITLIKEALQESTNPRLQMLGSIFESINTRAESIESGPPSALRNLRTARAIERAIFTNNVATTRIFPQDSGSAHEVHIHDGIIDVLPEFSRAQELGRGKSKIVVRSLRITLPTVSTATNYTIATARSVATVMAASYNQDIRGTQNELAILTHLSQNHVAHVVQPPVLLPTDTITFNDWMADIDPDNADTPNPEWEQNWNVRPTAEQALAWFNRYVRATSSETS